MCVTVRGMAHGSSQLRPRGEGGRHVVVVHVGGAHPVSLLDGMPNGAFPAMHTMSVLTVAAWQWRIPHERRYQAPCAAHHPLRGPGGGSPLPLPWSCPFGFVRDATDAGPAGCRERCVVRCESLCLCL